MQFRTFLLSVFLFIIPIFLGFLMNQKLNHANETIKYISDKYEVCLQMQSPRDFDTDNLAD